jgi:hypothetical protein
MSCCGGSRPKRVRRQVVDAVSAQAVPAPQSIQRKIKRQAGQAASIQRQHVVPRQQCVKCGYPTMLVHIANRERYQCSNANCRLVVQ